MQIFYFVILMLMPLMMIAIGGSWRKRPPKSINWIYGYRTTRSMKSQEAWEFAHKYVGELWFKLGIITIIISLIFLFILSFTNDATAEKMFVAWSLIQAILLIIPIIPTEIALKKNFDNYGKQK